MIKLGKAIMAIALGNGKTKDSDVVPIIGNDIPVIPCRKEAIAKMNTCTIVVEKFK